MHDVIVDVAPEESVLYAFLHEEVRVGALPLVILLQKSYNLRVFLRFKKEARIDGSQVSQLGFKEEGYDVHLVVRLFGILLQLLGHLLRVVLYTLVKQVFLVAVNLIQGAFGYSHFRGNIVHLHSPNSLLFEELHRRFEYPCFQIFTINCYVACFAHKHYSYFICKVNNFSKKTICFPLFLLHLHDFS